MGRTLYVAAGGGGDAIAAWALHRSQSEEPPIIATFSWDRLLFDPLPGPRCVDDFRHLESVDELNFAIRPDSELVPPAGSTLPRLATELDGTFLLLDPRWGAQGLRSQLSRMVATFECKRVEVVDVGGDILAVGDEEALLSPLADSLILAALAPDIVDTDVAVIGAGLDGELEAKDVRKYGADLSSQPADSIAPDVATRVLGVLDWFPSEATAVLIGAVLGHRGAAQVRDARRTVQLDDEASSAFRVTCSAAWHHNEIARELARTTSLDEAEAVVRRRRGRTEIDYERAKVTTLRARHDDMTSVQDLESKLLTALAALRQDDVELVTYRRLAERLETTIEEASALVQRLDLRGASINCRPLVRTIS